MKTIKQIEAERCEKVKALTPYKFTHFTLYNYAVLNKITSSGYNYYQNKRKHANCFIMADTETSKDKTRYRGASNHVVIWTISIRSMGFNWVTLWGNKPSDLCKAFSLIKDNLKADDVSIYWHNMSYDYVFCRKFLFKQFGTPSKQLSTKPHFPILFKWASGLILKDSYILAQRSLEKWGEDLDVEHKKAVGFWDYDVIRNQDFTPSEEEATYIEFDTLCGVECLDKMRLMLGKRYNNMPYTATGIVREELRKIAFAHGGRELFLRLVGSYETQRKLESCYHGGFTHGDRYSLGEIIHDVVCKDFTSSYPFVLLAFKYPMEKFCSMPDMNLVDILKDEENGYIFRLTMENVRLKNPFEAMPSLQYSKVDAIKGEVLDNGRITSCEAVSIYMNDIDASIIYEQYEADYFYCSEVEASALDYLPRWFTDFIYKCYEDKCTLAGVDPILYNLAKYRVNSLYGCCVQKPIRESDIEDYETGDYKKEEPKKGETHEEMCRRLYQKFVSNRNSFLVYQWGVWCTSLAMKQLFTLGKCTNTELINGHVHHRWIYSDTDSIYSDDWNIEKVEAFNADCKARLKANGYDVVKVGEKEYWLGTATTKPLEDEYSEYKVLGAKRYAGRCKEDNLIHITVAGVPKKKGALCLNDNLDKFEKGFVFKGTDTGKKEHIYIYVDEIYIDEDGNEIGDSIDFQPSDYTLDEAKIDAEAYEYYEDEDIGVSYEEE